MARPANEFPFLDWPGPIPFAHRGGASECPENTMSAFQRAVDLGYTYLETDVHVTADGVLVAFHDDTLDRVSDRAGRIADLPWSAVAEARVGADGSETVPLFEDLLGTWPECRVNVDPKHDSAVEPLIDALHRTAAFDRVCVGAFSDRRLATVRRLGGPRLATSLGPRDIGRLRAASYGVPSGPLPSPCVQVPLRRGRIPLVDVRLVDAAHRRQMQVHVWTIDDAAEMRRLLDLGVDGIMTDRPAVLRDVLEERGAWVAA